MHTHFRSACVLILACIFTLLAVRTALAAGAVTDCTTFGPGPGTLATAVAGGGLVTFECSGTIVFPTDIKLVELPGETLVMDGSGQRVILSGGGVTRLFNVGPKSHLSLYRLTLTAGNAGLSGGGAIQSGGYVTITESALLSNTAAYGGALELYNGSAMIRNSTLAGNRALDADNVSGGGGAIDQYFMYVEGNVTLETEVPAVTIINSTIVNNEAVIGARSGLWQESGRLHLRYSLVANNAGGNCMVAPPDRQRYQTVGSLDSDGTCYAALRADPQLGPLSTGNGSTPVYPLLRTSPAIDAAGQEACAGALDQRGLLRPRDGNRDGAPGCDVGAYEYVDRFVVLAADEGLAGYWKFDEGAGAASMDSSGHSLTATLHSGAGFTAGTSRLHFASPFALYGNAAAGAQVADAPALHGVDELTVAAWVRLDSSSGLQQILSKMQNSGSGPGYGLFVRDGILSGETWDSAGARHVITSEVITNSWLHVALTYQANREQWLYLNGNAAGVQTVTGTLAASSAPLIMAVDGAIDDVRIYSRTLSAGEVAAVASGRGCVTPGSTWGDAVPDLQCALLEATAGSEVWLGPGLYRPTYGPDRTATFVIGDGVAVYGGFAGGESAREQRLPQTPQPVLSGDIQANDRVDAAGVLTDAAGLVGGNAFHVVSISSTLTSTSVLEDVTITGGQADGPVGTICGNSCGGGLAVIGGAPQLSRLRLIGNRAAAWGGALYAERSSTQLISSTLEANQAALGGGAFWQGGAPLLANSLLAGNLATEEGGGLYAFDSSMRMVNVTVAGNRAGARGGGLLINGGGSSASNLLAAANAAPEAAQAGGNGVTLQRSLVQDGCPATFVCAADVLTADPLLAAAHPISAPLSGGDYRLLPTSPAIDIGDNEASLGAGGADGSSIASFATDLAGAPRIIAARMLPPQIDLGAYEAPNTPPLFVSAPITSGTTTIEYTYEVVAVDPNLPDELLAVQAAALPPWLVLEQEQNGPAHLHGTPGKTWYGYSNVRLQSADKLGATTEQAFTIHVLERVYSLFLAHVAR